MEAAEGLQFGPYRLASAQGPLWKAGAVVALQPKAMAVLWLLATRAGEVVTKDVLFATIWGQTIVSEGALTVCIRQIREALGDTAATAQYIATVHRIGYRFIAPVTADAATVPRSTVHVAREETQPSVLHPQLSILVGRDPELTQLHELFALALSGRRQLVFVTGEAGVGKTALIEAFVQGLETLGQPETQPPTQKASAPDPRRPTPEVWIAWGQCIEHYGTGEAYLPVLEALGRLCQGAEGEEVVEVLRRVAPTWLVQLPAIGVEDAEWRWQLADVPRERMLRELAEALEALSAVRPLVIVLEDLHWSDPSTIEVLSMIARRREAARLLVVGTVRPAELIVTNHPLNVVRHELVMRGQAQEILLGMLPSAAVRQYVERRLPEREEAEDALVALISRRSEGHPLFMVHMTDYVAQHPLGRTSVTTALAQLEQELPQGVREMIAMQVERLGQEGRHVLETGSVGGVEFGSAMLAAGLGVEPEVVDEVCAELSTAGQFVRAVGVREWPDGTLSGRYQFRHVLYQEVLYRRLPEVQRVRLHRKMGERLKGGYGQRARERAAELAMHFERGRIIEKAVEYYHLAGENALQRSAHQEAVLQFTKGLALAETLLKSSSRLAQQLRSQTLLVPALMALEGHTSVAVEQAYLRAQALCEEAGDTQRLFFARLGLFRFYNTRGAYRQAYEYATLCLTQATAQPDTTLLVGAHYAVGLNAFYQGQLTEAQAQTAQGIASYTSAQHQTYALEYGFDPVVGCLSIGALTLWLQGYPDQAQHQIGKALRTAQEQPRPFTLTYAQFLSALGAQFLRQEQEAATQAEAVVTLATQHGFRLWLAAGTFLLGWSQSAHGEGEGGIQQMRSSLFSLQEIGVYVHRAHCLALLAETVGHTGDSVQALQLIEQALRHIDQSGERFYEAEAWRIKGALALQSSVQGLAPSVKKSSTSKAQRSKLKIHRTQAPHTQAEADAEACFLKAINVARQQQAKSLELRATISLVRLRQQQGTQPKSRRRLVEARRMLAEVYEWFTEGFATKDLQEAKALLNELNRFSYKYSCSHRG